MQARGDGPPEVSLWELFRTFLQIAVSGFGGALPWGRRMLVERRGWLTERDFAETLGICQVVPGGNMVNISVLVGARYHGALGALAAVVGLLAAPFLIVSALGLLYAYGAQFELVRTATRGVAVVAVGLIVSTGVKLTLAYRRDRLALLMIGLAFAAVGLLRLPLIGVLLVLAPCSIVLVRRYGR